MSDFHNKRTVTTRKAYRCDWCHLRIEKASPCVVTNGMFEGDFYRGRYHPECSEATTRYYQTNRCWGEEMPEGPMERGGIRWLDEVPVTSQAASSALPCSEA